MHLEQGGDLVDGLAAVQGQQSDGSLVHAHVGDVLELLAQEAALTRGQAEVGGHLSLGKGMGRKGDPRCIGSPSGRVELIQRTYLA